MQLNFRDGGVLKGVYTLIISLKEPITLKIGKLGTFTFPSGTYTYTGSAMGIGALSLENRINRHLRRRKKLKWHIDYFLNSKHTQIESIIYAETDRKSECIVTKQIEKLGMVHVPVKKFGASDCKKGCHAHLHHFKCNSSQAQEIITKIYSKVGLKPKLFNKHFL